MADRLIESPLHAARFVSLIPFHRMEAPGAEKVEVWHSMQSFLSRVSSKINYFYNEIKLTLILLFRAVEILRTTLCSYATYF